MADTSELLRQLDRLDALAKAPVPSPTKAGEYWLATNPIDVLRFTASVREALKSRLQAEAQSPTTAASVLTEDERAAVADACEFIDQSQAPVSLRHVTALYAIIDRLVGAPAPRTINAATVQCPACGQHVEFKFGAPLDVRAVVGAPAPAPTKFVAVNSAQDIDAVIADMTSEYCTHTKGPPSECDQPNVHCRYPACLTSPAKGDTP